MKFRTVDLKVGKLSQVTQVGSVLAHEALTAAAEGRRESQGDLKYEKELTDIAGLKTQGPQVKEMGTSVQN